MAEPSSTAIATQSGQPAARGPAVAPIMYGVIARGFLAHGDDTVMYVDDLVLPFIDVAAAYDRLTYADIPPLVLYLPLPSLRHPLWTPPTLEEINSLD